MFVCFLSLFISCIVHFCTHLCVSLWWNPDMWGRSLLSREVLWFIWVLIRASFSWHSCVIIGMDCISLFSVLHIVHIQTQLTCYTSTLPLLLQKGDTLTYLVVSLSIGNYDYTVHISTHLYICTLYTVHIYITNMYKCYYLWHSTCT